MKLLKEFNEYNSFEEAVNNMDKAFKDLNATLDQSLVAEKDLAHLRDAWNVVHKLKRGIKNRSYG